MSSPDARHRLRAEVRAAADVLRREWDPICAGTMADLPPDEYDTYAPRIVDLIETGADDQAIAAYFAASSAKPSSAHRAVVFLSSQPHFGAPSQRPHTLPANVR